MAFVRKKRRGDATYLYLVESYRENGKVKQRILEYLGKEGSIPDLVVPNNAPNAVPNVGNVVAVAANFAPNVVPNVGNVVAAPPYSMGAAIWYLGCCDQPLSGTVTAWDGRYLTLSVRQTFIREVRLKPERVLGYRFQVGDWVKFWCSLGGVEGEHYGTVIEGTTQVEACPWPKRGRGSRELVTIAYQPPGTVTIRYQWLTQTCEMQTPVGRVWYPGGSPPPIGGAWQRCD